MGEGCIGIDKERDRRITQGCGGEVWIRADSAFYDHNFLNWARDGFRGEGRIKKIYFAISSVMSEEL